jgi:hypothetical protein
MKNWFTITLLASALVMGCKKSHTHSGHHHHDPPHGGTGVTLGDEAYHLEFVRDAATGRMQCYILSGHMAGFTRIAMPAFEVEAMVGDKAETLTFKPVENTRTGETVGDTSLYEAQADWLKTTETFDGTVKMIEIKGTKFADVKFNFPKGN